MLHSADSYIGCYGRWVDGKKRYEAWKERNGECTEHKKVHRFMQLAPKTIGTLFPRNSETKGTKGNHALAHQAVNTVQN